MIDQEARIDRQRLDHALAGRGLVSSRSQAESWIRLGKVFVNDRVQQKPGFLVSDQDKIELRADEQYVSRAALKLASVTQKLKLDFEGKVVLDVGSSTGGFTDFALKAGARKVIAVDVGTNQLHPSLRNNPKVELHEQTDVRQVGIESRVMSHESSLIAVPDIILVDVSFVSLRDILPHVSKLMTRDSDLVAMVKPQFEAGDKFKHKGVVKNDRMRREILKQFEQWTKKFFAIVDKADSEVAGSKGNLERFYLLKKIK